MSVPANLGEKQELLDTEIQAHIEGANGAATDRAPEVSAEERCGKLSEECERLRSELAEVREERDAHLKAVYALLRDHPRYNQPLNFTREEVFRCLGQRPTLREFIKELENSPESDHA